MTRHDQEKKIGGFVAFRTSLLSFFLPSILTLHRIRRLGGRAAVLPGRF
jgi:hypothetical protein